MIDRIICFDWFHRGETFMVVILWITLEAATERVMSDKKKMMVVIAVGEKIRKDRENER